MTTIAIDGMTVHTQRETAAGTERTAHHCATRRVAQILASELELREAGWTVSGLSSSDRPRRPLVLPEEKMGWVLDGARSDERAQGFSARRGVNVIVVDACACLSPIVVVERGDTADARRIVEYHLGPLS